MSATEIDQTKLEAFMGQAVTDMGAIISAPLMSIGEKLGRTKQWPTPAIDLAGGGGALGASERYVREWLGNQAAGG